MELQDKKEESHDTGETHSLDLDPEVLQKDDHVSTSLCDRFGIHMYSEEFLKKEQIYKQQKKENEEYIFRNVLNNEENLMIEETFQRVIQAEGGTVIKAEYKMTEKQSPLWSTAGYILVGAMIAGVILFFIDKRRRRHCENNHYYQK